MMISAPDWATAVTIALGLLKSGYQVLLTTDEFQASKPAEEMGVTIDFVNTRWDDDKFMLESECYPNETESEKP